VAFSSLCRLSFAACSFHWAESRSHRGFRPSSFGMESRPVFPLGFLPVSASPSVQAFAVRLLIRSGQGLFAQPNLSPISIFFCFPSLPKPRRSRQSAIFATGWFAGIFMSSETWVGLPRLNFLPAFDFSSTFQTETARCPPPRASRPLPERATSPLTRPAPNLCVAGAGLRKSLSAELRHCGP